MDEWERYFGRRTDRLTGIPEFWLFLVVYLIVFGTLAGITAWALFI